MKQLLPALPYDYAALEPHIDARTMELHHDLKHQNRRPGYLKNWWSVANWQEAARRFDGLDPSAERNSL